ncbi:HsdM family class I SAM-dependent methyltransferase, partial [Spirulina sp. 06S082]|uniref:HsdM family class I SAM-dependent methyltransferase n=1 Tax=Spirulina sp. 06S082 TaxID=3110248 RepID=UPI002B1EB4C3
MIGTVNEISQIEKQLDYLFAESIDSGNIWKVQAENLTVDRRVDVHLLNNLEKLGKRLTNKGLELSIAHALIGKYVYIRYLRDRGILSDRWLEEKQINLDSVLSRNATLQGLRRIIEVLEERFEGDIFPLPLSGKNAPSDEKIRLVASVFKGDDIESGQLHLDFEAYKFEYIPIELLSSIYEQFLRSQGKSKKHGAIYTPEPLADYMISELNSVRPLEKGMKILDPCCGSGIFLVLAYRRLIEKEAQKNFYERVSPEKVKEILLESCYGVERNRDACYITEFSLILTMLDYIDPPDLHKNQDFKFPKLHNERVFECDLFDDLSKFWKRNEKFDWIIGNPPFIELKKETKGEEYIRNWLKTYSQKTVTGNRVCEAFTWRVTDLLKLEKTIGYVALLIHAPSLFNGESEKYRKDFFQQHEIRRVTNFSHLARVLFYKRAKVAVATIVYKIGNADGIKPNFIHYAPFRINQISNKSWQEERQNQTWTITINENEIQAISHNDIETGEMLPWKLALWGSYRDKKIIQRLNRLFSKTIGELCKEKGWNITSGLEWKDISKLSVEKQSEVVRESSLIDKQLLNIEAMNKSSFIYSVPKKILKKMTERNCYIRRPAGLRLISAPHLVIHPNFIAYSDLDFVIPNPHVGISGKPSDAQYLQSLTIFLNSSLIKYYLFFVSPAWGIGRHRIDLKPTKKIPVPDFTDKQMNELSKFYLQLEELENSERFAEISQDMIDRKIEEVFNISPNIRTITREFWKVRFSLNEGKIVGTATDLPTQE